MIPHYENLTYQQFQQALAQHQQYPLKLVFFYGSWCGVCKPILPQLDSVGARLGQGEAGFPIQMVITLIDADPQTYSQMLGFQTVPTFVLYGQGHNPEVIAGHEGPMNEPEIMSWARQNVAPLLQQG